MKNFALGLSFLFCLPVFAQDSHSPLVSFDDYENLMKTVKEHRKSRLVNLNTFNQMSAENDVYILDTRSKEMYDRKHVKGAIHLNFSDFTQTNLDSLFPNRNATILIYCNNNFHDNLPTDFTELNTDVLRIHQLRVDENFASKVSRPEIKMDLSNFQSSGATQGKNLQTKGRMKKREAKNSIPTNEKPITLALNIPTYINLYGYGYRNVYELSELISVRDERIQFEGTEVISTKN